ncbi:hypothetical protein [Priestia megaterium]|uniref:hypothetical protein n=1 Tax=Priestia megaterium TaxID=1404 RepID=UPI002E20DB66|nr:hypothetical protein [Priestia megaterium]MED4102165.1 hypothetical protein [Priestia megaterium]MED4142592.1 hypothetical protein [Priestia megaterium]
MKFHILVFMSESAVTDPDDGGKMVYEFVTEYPEEFTAEDVAKIFAEQKFITYPHGCDRGVTLLNMNHISEIAIHEFDEEEQEEEA